MSKLTSLAIIFFLLLSFKVESQTTDTTDFKFKFGIGIDFEMVDYDNYPSIPPTHIVANLDIGDVFRIEPGIGYKTTNDNYDTNGYVRSSKRYSYSLGAYWLIGSKKTRPYIGLDLNYIKTINETIDDNSSSENIRKESRIGPVLGIEYKFHRRFSIGGEFLFLRTNSNSTHIRSNGEETEGFTDGWKTGNRIKFRFYF